MTVVVSWGCTCQSMCKRRLIFRIHICVCAGMLQNVLSLGARVGSCAFFLAMWLAGHCYSIVFAAG